MNNAQLQGMRMTAEEMKVVRHKMTAREMALTAHKLNRSGEMATLTDGSVYVWDARFDQWSMWKASRKGVA
jgi:hypothetical protein